METVNAYLFRALARYGELPMQVSRGRTWTYRDAARAVHGVARRLAAMGVRPGDRVAIVSENRPEWMHAYLGILAAGAVAVPRSEDCSEDELRYVLDHSGSRVVFAASEKVARRPALASRDVLRMDASFPGPADVAEGDLDAYASARGESDIAVLLYTSGTTGRPKGAVLEHRNLAHNLRHLPRMVEMTPGDVWVSILPPWHTFEQTVELCAFSVGSTIVYSDKRRLREDLAEHRPHFFAAVPRVWEAIHDSARNAIAKRGPALRVLFRLACAGTRMRKRGNPLGAPLDWIGRKLFYGKIAAATGGRLKYAVSGGGYLPAHVDEFFATIGVRLLVGYGLTETAPVVALRDPVENRAGTIGKPLPETDVRVGARGTFLVRGPQVMREYYKEPDLTRAAMDGGWFDTGDLGRLTPEGDLVFVGRAKETIVLSGGENVEPEPIENKILESPLIEQVMLVGQDRKTLAALVVPKDDARRGPDLERKLRDELRARTGPAGGFRSFEGVNRFLILDEPFTPENGLLTQTLKKRRLAILDRYAEKIDELYRAG